MDICEQIKELKGNMGVSSVTQKARDDFRYAVAKTDYTAPNYLDYQAICKGSETLGYALAVPLNVEEKKCTVTASLVKADDPKMHVAVVCYKGGAAIDVLLFSSGIFVRSAKLDKKNGTYVLKIKDIDNAKIQQFALKNVIGNL